MTLTPNTTLRPTEPRIIGYSRDRSTRPSAPGTQLASSIAASYASSAPRPGRPTNSSRYLSTFDRFSLNSSCWMTVMRGSCSRGGRAVISALVFLRPLRGRGSPSASPSRGPRESRRWACPATRSRCAPSLRRAGRTSRSCTPMNTSITPSSSSGRSPMPCVREQADVAEIAGDQRAEAAGDAARSSRRSAAAASSNSTGT